jgi:hypothetical protein
LKEDRRFWNEQYLLEAFLSFNRDFEIICSLNHLMHLGSRDFEQAFPVLSEQRGPASIVGSFWLRRRLRAPVYETLPAKDPATTASPAESRN